MALTVLLAAQLGSRTEMLLFYVADLLATSIILGCDFFDKHVEAIHLSRRLVELTDGITVLIIRKPRKRHLDSPQFREEQ